MTIKKNIHSVHTVTTKSLLKNLKKPKRFFLATFGEHTVLYIGKSKTESLSIRKVNKALKVFPFINDDLIPSKAKWMLGTVKPVKEKGQSTLHFARSRGTATATNESKKKIKQVLKSVALSSVPFALTDNEELERTSQIIDEIITEVLVDSSDDDDEKSSDDDESSMESLVDGVKEEVPEVVENVTHTLGENITDLVTSTETTSGVVMESTLLSVGTLASGYSAYNELNDEETTNIEKGSSVVTLGTDIVKTVVETTESVMELTGGSEGTIDTLKEISTVGTDIVNTASVISSGTKMVKAGKELVESTQNKKTLREMNRRARLMDSLQRRLDDEAGETADRIVREMMTKFRKHKPPVGKKAVVNTLRLLTEVQTTRQKQSGVDMVSNGLKVTGGVVSLSGVGAHVGLGLTLAGSGVKLAKSGIDSGVQVLRNNKHEEESGLRETMTLDHNPELQERVQEVSDELDALRRRRKEEAARLRALKSEAFEAKENLRQLKQSRKLLQTQLDEVELDIDDLVSKVLDDGDDTGRSLEERLDALDEMIAGQADWERKLWAKVKAQKAVLKGMEDDKHALESQIATELVPEIFSQDQQKRLQSLLDGKDLRHRSIDGHEVSTSEQIDLTFSVNEDGSHTAMEQRREEAVEVLMNGKIPTSLRVEMIAILGLSEEDWETLQEQDEDTRRRTLKALMVV